MTFEEIVEFMENELEEKLRHINITYGFIGAGDSCKFWMELNGDKEKDIVGKVIMNTLSFPIEKEADFLRLVDACANNLVTMHILPHPIDIENSKSVGEYEI